MANQFGENYNFNGDITSRNGVSIDVKDLIQYYITENHSKLETIEYFKVNGSFISKMILHYNIKKSRQLSNVHNKRTCLERYGDPTYNNIEQNKKTCLEKYGVENVYQAEEIKKKIEETKLEKYGDAHFTNIEKQQQTNIDRYGVAHPLLNKDIAEKAKQTCLEHYGVEYPMQSDEVKAKYNFDALVTKAFNTKKLHGTTNTSKIQALLIDKLKEIYGDSDVFTEYKEERYPYHCDIYVKSLDTFIELNLFFTHGKHPFNSESEEDIKLLETWKMKSAKSQFFRNAINVWTVSDPEKQKCARDNNLNYIMFYTEKEVKDYIKKLEDK